MVKMCHQSNNYIQTSVSQSAYNYTPYLWCIILFSSVPRCNASSIHVFSYINHASAHTPVQNRKLGECRGVCIQFVLVPGIPVAMQQLNVYIHQILWSMKYITSFTLFVIIHVTARSSLLQSRSCAERKLI